MGQTALTSPLENLVGRASPIVHARRGDVWEHGGAAFGDDVRALAAALAGYGLVPGTCAAVLGSEGCDCLLAELSVLCAGASLVSLDSPSSDETLLQSLVTSGVVHAVACDEKQLARLLRVRPDLPSLDLVLLMKAEPSERKAAALLARTAVQVGAATLKAEPSLLTDALAAGGQSQSVLVIDADGRGKSVDRGELLRLADRIGAAIRSHRNVLSALPRTSVLRLATALAVVGRGATLLLADPTQRLDSGLADHPVDGIVSSLGELKRLRQAWQADISRRSWVGRSLVTWSLRQGANPARTGWKHRVAEVVALRDLRRALGASVTRLNIPCEDPETLDSESVSFFEAIGLPISYQYVNAPPSSGASIAVR